jgi:hypothetical protein
MHEVILDPKSYNDFLTKDPPYGHAITLLLPPKNARQNYVTRIRLHLCQKDRKDACDAEELADAAKNDVWDHLRHFTLRRPHSDDLRTIAVDLEPIDEMSIINLSGHEHWDVYISAGNGSVFVDPNEPGYDAGGKLRAAILRRERSNKSLLMPAFVLHWKYDKLEQSVKVRRKEELLRMYAIGVESEEPEG